MALGFEGFVVCFFKKYLEVILHCKLNSSRLLWQKSPQDGYTHGNGLQQPSCSAQHFWRCSRNPDLLWVPLQDTGNSESSNRDRSTPLFCEGTFPVASSRPTMIHSASLRTRSLLQCLDIKTSCYNQSCLFSWLFMEYLCHFLEQLI